MIYRGSAGKPPSGSSRHAGHRKLPSTRSSNRVRRRNLLIGGAASVAIAATLMLLFPLRDTFVEVVAAPALDMFHEAIRWFANRSQIAVWRIALAATSVLAVLAVRPPRRIERKIRLHRRNRPIRDCSDREILIRAIHHGHRHVLYRVLVARQMTRLAVRLIRQRERCSNEVAATKLQQGNWPAPDSIRAFLGQRLPTAHGLRVSEKVYAAQLSETVGFLERYAEGEGEDK